MNSLHFIRATARGADGEQPAAARWRHPAWWRGKLPLCFGGMVNRKTDIVSSWLYKNYIKTLDRCEKRVETQGISFCQKQFPVNPCAWCLGRSSLEAVGAFAWISVGFGGSWWLKNQMRTRIPSSEQRFRSELGPALGICELSCDSALEVGSAASFLGWII